MLWKCVQPFPPQYIIRMNLGVRGVMVHDCSYSFHSDLWLRPLTYAIFVANLHQSGHHMYKSVKVRQICAKTRQLCFKLTLIEDRNEWGKMCGLEVSMFQYGCTRFLRKHRKPTELELCSTQVKHNYKSRSIM